MKNGLILLFVVGLLINSSAQVKVHVNFDLRHTVGGEDTFDRKKWMTVHSSNYEGAWQGELDKKDYLLNELDVYLTRETGTVTQEVSSRTAAQIQANASNFKAQYGSLTDRHPFESKQNLIVANQHRIYEEMSATEAGERSAAFMNNYFGTGGADGMPRPTYFELLNEPVFPLFDFGDQTLDQIFDYHIEMAQKIKELSPTTPVGGYVGAFSIFEEDNFQRWNDRWKTYIDDVGDFMDFYSWHLYDFPGINNGIEQYRKGANNEATFDMMEHYTRLVDKERPFVISEYGSQLHDWYEEDWSSFRDWLFIKATNSMLMGFLERPDKIAVTLPFTVIKAQWGYGAFQMGEDRVYPWRMMRQETEPESYTVNGFTGEWVWTEYIKFYELWDDVDGTRVDTRADDINVLVDAYINGDKAYLIVNNLIPETLTFEPDIKGLGSNGISGVSVRNLYFDTASDVVRLDVDEESFNAENTYELLPEATMVFEYTLNDAMVIDQTSEETKYYATTYLQPITADQEINFALEDVTLGNEGEAVLRIGVGRDLGQSLDPLVTVNGQTLVDPVEYRGDNQEERPRFFGVLEVNVPYNTLEESNTVTVTFPDNGGHVSSLALQVFNFSRPVIRTAIEGFGVLTNTITIATGKTRQMLTNFTPSNATNKVINWSSTNESIATVDESGLVSAIAEGTVTINAVTEGTDAGGNTFMSNATVTVQDDFVLLMDSVVFTEGVVSVTLGETINLQPQIFPAETDDPSLQWVSDDEAIATVNANGEVNALAIGSATITTTSQDGSNVSGSLEVEVIQPAFIEFVNPSVYLETDYVIGENIEITSSYSAGNGLTVNNNGIKFWLREITEGFGAVVNDYTVDVTSAAGTNTGTVSASIALTDNITPTADLPEGNFYFLFSSFNNSQGDFIENGIFPITILGPDLDGLTLNTNALDMIEQETEQLEVTFSPANANDRSLTWSSSDDLVASVDASGLVTATGAGSTTIRATSAVNASIFVEVQVNVSALVELTAISVVPENPVVAVGGSLQLEAVLTPANASYPEVTWNSDDETIASIDE
ncbi:MAG: Ig-like domain-containing protein, partial [Bacteroidota bacterium]